MVLSLQVCQKKKLVYDITSSTFTPRLADCKVTAEWIDHLAFALKYSYSALRHLDLSNNDLKDSGVEQLCDGLSSQCCRVETLRYCFWPHK